MRKSSNPFIIQEPLVSPGCTRAVTTTARFTHEDVKGRCAWVCVCEKGDVLLQKAVKFS